MRFVTLPLFFVFFIAIPAAHASGFDEKSLDPAAIEALALKADQAQPKEKCFLYAEVVHQMTELAGRQFHSGDILDGSATLKKVQRYAEKIHLDLTADTKKLKNAELLMQHTSFRLRDILDSASYDDRQTLDATLKDLNQVQDQLMMEVFKK